MKLHAAMAALSRVACLGPPRPATDAHPESDASAGLDASLDDADPGSPDFAVDMGRTQIDLSIVEESFSPDACELEPSEDCIGAPGLRRLLRFSVETANLGQADIVLGAPDQSPGFEYSQCHEHYHFQGYASYRLLDAAGEEVLVGRKQAFCLLDSEPYLAEASPDRVYSCLHQGLQAGWADVYAADLPCQFLDISGIPDGTYTLEVEVNPDGLLPDASSANNLGTISVTLGDSALETPTEACEDLPARYLDRIHRECEWDFAGEFECTPGSLTGAGCSQNCGVGSCTGDPMIRVCDAEEPNCTSSVALDANNDRCGHSCPLANDVICPDSGRIAVYTAAFHRAEAYTCDIVVGQGPQVP